MSMRALADTMYAEEVARALAMRREDKLLEGPRLFERSCRIIADGIRHEHPGIDSARVRELVAERVTSIDVVER